MESNARIIILLGPPGSGKGTQGERLAKAFGLPSVSTGSLLRNECERPTATARRLRETLASGRLLDDDTMNGLVTARLDAPDCGPGAILDGYPRTAAQAAFLDNLLAGRGVRARPIVFQFEIAAGTVVRRLERRRECPVCGQIYGAGDGRLIPAICRRDGVPLATRADDRLDTVFERLKIYEANAAKLADFYRGPAFHRICADQRPELIARQLGELMEANSKPFPARSQAWAAPV